MPIPIHDGRTNDLYHALTQCEDINDVRIFLDRYSEYFTDWKAFINCLLDSGGYSYTQFARICHMSRNTIVSWCEQGKIPRSREQFIRIAFAVHMSVAETNDFLQRYGKYPRLNAKNIEDAVTVFSLCRQLSYEQCYALKERFSPILCRTLQARKLAKDKDYIYFSTTDLETELLHAGTLGEFEAFVQKNAEAFANSYVQLLDFLDSYVAMNATHTGKAPGTLNAFLSETISAPSVVAGFNTMISKLRCRGTVPARMHLIALGIHLGMTAGDISTMLGFAGMEPLCAKDKLESIILFAAENAVLQNPEIEFSNALLLKQYTKNAGLRAKCDAVIRQFELAGYHSDSSADLFEYITEALFRIDSGLADDILFLLGKETAARNQQP
ncbi:MAG: helix-turn-helix domain-containing protein [Clostridium sp.]|nr:helix-turn-helix domain-containing protein [Clostridium sp.]